MNKTNLRYICLIMAIFMLCGCDVKTGDVKDQYYDVMQSDDPHVLGVKHGHPSTYPDITYEDAFEYFFGYPTWKYFEGKRNDSDTLYEVVEFTGRCLYQETEVKALLQFTMNDDGKTFSPTYLSFNDVPQSELIMLALIEKAFSSYEEYSEMNSKKADPVQ